MDIERIIDFVDSKVFEHCGRRLNADEVILLKGTLGNKNYEEMAQEADRTFSYLRGDVMPRLNHLLSEVFEERIVFPIYWKIRLEQLYLKSLTEIE